MEFKQDGTRLWREHDYGEKSSLALNAHLFQIIDSKVSRLSTYINFIPSMMPDWADDVFSRLPTIMHILSCECTHDSFRPLEDANIFWLSTKNTNVWRQEAHRLVPDIPWHVTGVDRQLRKAYLGQLFLQCIAEAVTNGVTNILWNVGIPEGLTEAQKDDFCRDCQDALQEAYQGTSLENVAELVFRD